MIKTINSINNDLIKKIKKLKQTKYRKILKQFIGEGENTCIALLENHSCEILIFTERSFEKLKTKFSNLKIEKIIITEKIFKIISGLTNQNNLLGIFNFKKEESTKKIKTNSIALFSIADAGNLGTLIRTATAMNCSQIICVDNCVELYNLKVIQASAGVINKIPIIKKKLCEFIQETLNLNTISMVVTGGMPPQNINFSNSILCIGAEAHGLPKEFISSSKQQLTLPMQGEIESLNAAVAGSIGIFLSKYKI